MRASSHSGDLGIVGRIRVDSPNRHTQETGDEQTNEIREPIAPYLIIHFSRKVTAGTYDGKKLGRDMGFH